MSYIIFENAGEIDPLLIKTFGVSVKESDSPIGFFGTGLKYALAILLRTGHEVSIQAGERVLAFGRQTATLRGKAFNLVTMDGEPLGFTDEVGKTWDVWMAYREIYCNAKDEGGSVYEAEEAPAPQSGVTRIIVKGEDFVREHGRRSAFILIGKPLFTLDGCDVYSGETQSVFYRGVAVYRMQGDQRSRYTYNVTRSIELTEDRTAKYPILLPMHLATSIIGAEDEGFLRDLLVLSNSYYEHHFDFSSSGVWGTPKPAPQFLKAVATLATTRVGRVNVSAAMRYQTETRALLTPGKTELRGSEAEALKRATAFCDNLGFPVERYPITVTDTLGPGILGMAKDGHIYLSRQALMQGTKRTCSTLIEEYIHLHYGYADETREFEDFLIDRIVSLGEEMHGETL